MTTQCKVTIAGGTGLAEDVVVNTFHFGQPADPKYAVPADLFGWLETFYNTPAPNETRSIASFIGPDRSRNVDVCRMDLYDLNDPQPRTPYASNQWTLGAGNDPTGLPSEVAMVISWTADPVSGVPAGRLRGRTYIGTLSQDAADTTAGLVRPFPTVLDVLVESGQRLIADAIGNLVIYSRASIPPAAHPITGGHVDNAFDTQRRRGLGPTSRRTFV